MLSGEQRRHPAMQPSLPECRNSGCFDHDAGCRASVGVVDISRESYPRGTSDGVPCSFVWPDSPKCWQAANFFFGM